MDGLPLAVRDYCLVTGENEHLEEIPGALCKHYAWGWHPDGSCYSDCSRWESSDCSRWESSARCRARAWNRSPLQRLLPPGALIRPTLAAVAGVIPGDPPSQASSGVEIKVRVAYASSQFEALIRAEEPEDVFEPVFCRLRRSELHAVHHILDKTGRRPLFFPHRGVRSASTRQGNGESCGAEGCSFGRGKSRPRWPVF